MDIHTNGDVIKGEGYYIAKIDKVDIGYTECRKFEEAVTLSQAKYAGFIRGLMAVEDEYTTDVNVYTDSKLILNQMSGKWAVNDPALRVLWKAATRKISDLTEMGYSINILPSILDVAPTPDYEYQSAEMPILALMQVSKTASLEARGYELLASDIVVELDRRHYTWAKYEGVTDSRLRKALHRFGGRRASMLLRAPSLAAVTSEGPILIATQTSYLMDNGVGFRVVGADMWDALSSLVEGGHRVNLIHRPFGSGKWRTAEELGWGSDKEHLTQPLVAGFEDLAAYPIKAPKGWGEMYELTLAEGWWRTVGEWLDGEWEDGEEWVNNES